jgi:uncharacterized protein (DUF885 family)
MKTFLHGVVFGILTIYSSVSFALAEPMTSEVKSKEDTKFEILADDIWQFSLERNPLRAASYSETSPSKLADISPKALEFNNKKHQQQLSLLQDIQVAKLSEQNQINLSILRHKLNNSIDNYRFKAFQIPITAEGGFHTSLAFLPRSISFKTETDVENYLSLLSQIPDYFDQQIAYMSDGLKSGNSQPKVVLQGFEHSIDGFIVEDASESLFYQPFKSGFAFLTPEKNIQLQARAKKVIEQQVIYSYQTFKDFITDTYTPNARTSIGVQYTPDGKKYYQNRAVHYTTTDLSAEEIHKLGLSEVKRIKSEMEEIIVQLNFKGSFAEFLHFLRTDPQFYATTAEQLLKEASFIAKKMDAQLPKFFKLLPRTPYGVAPVPAHIAPKYTTGRYVGSSKPTDPGYYWVNTYALDRRPLYELEALTLHESVPGHHLQISLTKEMENTPVYRSSYYMSAFGEGWGLYSEWLGLEAGFYQDPYSNFGRLTYEMWRATRLVVDTGMHTMDWTRQQSIDYMKQNSALSEHNITTEVDRYISWPEQALSYKIGELTIKNLRQKAEQSLGNKFDIREFHYHVLKNGSVPLSLLEQQIDAYIQAELGKVKLTS